MTMRNTSKAPPHAPTSRALVELLSPTHLLPGQSTCDVYSLRHLILQRSGLPDAPSWIRPQAWSVLLRRIGPEKRDWRKESTKGREEYYALLDDVLPDGDAAEESIYDPLLAQIQSDLVRSRFNAFAFFQAGIPPSASCPITPLPQGCSEEPSPSSSTSHTPTSAEMAILVRRRARKRYALIDRTEGSGQTKAKVSSSAPQEPAAFTTHLRPPSVKGHSSDRGSNGAEDDDRLHSADEGFASLADAYRDRRTTSIPRILFLYALLNPSVGYVQGMVEVASVVLWTIGSATGLPKSESEVEGEEVPQSNALNGLRSNDSTSPEKGVDLEPITNPHFEADAFWCFSLLLGELRELWDFEGIDHFQAGLRVSNARSATENGEGGAGNRKRGEVGGMARTLRRLGGRLRWADEELWAALSSHGLSPSMPYYAFRWLATLLSTSLPLPSLTRVWDALLCESDASSPAQADGSLVSSSQRDAVLGGKVEYLIDILTALLMSHRRPLLDILSGTATPSDEDVDTFELCLTYLQNLPDEDISSILEMATILKHRRIAASLCGEDEPPVDERDGVGGASTVTDRAMSAFRGWTSTGNNASPTRSFSGANWLKSVSTSESATSPLAKGPSVIDPSSKSQSSPTTLFSKYANALQSSDAAAELSKRGTNLTARAMEKWGGSGSGSPSYPGSTGSPLARRSVSEAIQGHDGLPKRPSPQPLGSIAAPSPSMLSQRLGSVSSTFRRTFSSNSTAAGSVPTSPSVMNSHPALQWNQDGMPQIPLPNVMDSPEGRTEYAYIRPGSILLSPRSAPVGRGSLTSPLSQSIASPNTPPHDPRSRSPSFVNGRQKETWSCPPSSFSPGNMPRDDRPLSSASSSHNGQQRSGGPKPLLLAGAARAARETTPDEGHYSAPVSKVVRTGPLAGGSSSPFVGRRGPRVGKEGSSAYASSASSSRAERTSSDRSRSSVSQSEDEPMRTSPSPPVPSTQTLVGATSLQEALQTAGSLPPLPSLAKLTQRPSIEGPRLERDVTNQPASAADGSAGGRGLVGKIGQGTAPARAFGGGATLNRSLQSSRETMTRTSRPSTPPDKAHTSETEIQTPRPDMKTVASSSDVPLVPTEGRQIRRRGGPGGNHVRRKSSSNSIVTMGSMSSSKGGNRSSRQHVSSVGSIGEIMSRRATLERPSLPDSSQWADGGGENHVARSADESSTQSKTAEADEILDGEDFPRRYELTDEPVSLLRSSNDNADVVMPEVKALPPPPSSPPPATACDQTAPEPITPASSAATRLSQPPRPGSSSSALSSNSSKAVARASKVRSKRSFKTVAGGGAEVPPSPLEGAVTSPRSSVPQYPGSLSDGGALSPIGPVGGADHQGTYGRAASPLSPNGAGGSLERPDSGHEMFRRQRSFVEGPCDTQDATKEGSHASLPPTAAKQPLRHYTHIHSESRSRIPADLPRDESDQESDRPTRPAAALGHAHHDSYGGSLVGEDDGDEEHPNSKAVDAIGKAFARFSTTEKYTHRDTMGSDVNDAVGEHETRESGIVVRDRAGGIKF